MSTDPRTAETAQIGCHPRCSLGPNADHPGYLEYRCITGRVEALPWPGEDGYDESLTGRMVEVLAEEFYLAVAQATRDHWLLWENLPHAERSGYYDLAYEVAEKLRNPDCDRYCDRGPCGAPREHDGTCAEASGHEDWPLPGAVIPPASAGGDGRG